MHAAAVAAFILLIPVIHGFGSLPTCGPPVGHWHCLSFAKNLDRTKPHKFRLGELPLVTWFDNATGVPITTLDVCRHMGSRLHGGSVKGGCLVCPYHGLKHGAQHRFGETLIFQDKLWWSLSPKFARPPASPFYGNKGYATSTVQVDMEASLMDSVFNVMDIVSPPMLHAVNKAESTLTQVFFRTHAGAPTIRAQRADGLWQRHPASACQGA